MRTVIMLLYIIVLLITIVIAWPCICLSAMVTSILIGALSAALRRLPLGGLFV